MAASQIGHRISISSRIAGALGVGAGQGHEQPGVV